MTFLKKIAIRELNTGEALQFMTTVSDVYKSFGSKSPLLDARFKELQDEVQAMTSIFMENRRATLNEKLKPLDTDRMNTLRGLKKFLSAEIVRNHQERASHAEALTESYNQYCAKTARLSFQHKTALITKLLDAWRTEAPLVKAIEVLNAQDWVTELTARNEVFYSNYFDNARSKSERIQSRIMKQRIKVIYDKLVMDINALVWVSDDKKAYEPLIRELNNIIEANNSPAMYRAARKKKKTTVFPALPVAYVAQ